jgi:effector-binding domain-containing protein
MSELTQTHVCIIKNLPATLVLAIRFRTASQYLPERLGAAYGALQEYLGQLQTPPGGAPYAAYFNRDLQDLEVEAGCPIDHLLPGRGAIQPRQLPAGPAATCVHVGPYTTLGDAYGALSRWMQLNGYEGDGTAYEFYLNDPDVVPPDALETEVAMPLRKG